jgi:hypothetical protein
MGLSAGTPAASAGAGLLGGAVVAFIYELIGALAFSGDAIGLPVPDVPALRVLAHLLTALAVAACATVAATPRPVKDRIS